MKTILRYMLYIFYAALGAATYGYITYTTIYPLLLDGYILAAHIANMLFILLILGSDKLEHYIIRKIYSKPRKRWIITTLRITFLGHISFKTGVYLFYIFILVASMLLQSEISMIFSSSFANYISTMDYGILFLIATDVFIKHLKIDVKRVQDLDSTK